MLLRLSLVMLFLITLASCVRAQETLNTTLRDRLSYADRLSDVWGYVAPDGTEYALVGLGGGLSVVSLADPDNIVEVANVSGDFSIWRDIKTYGEFAYVVADQNTSDDGIVVVDLSNLPTGVSAQKFATNNTSGADLVRAHNIYIDTTSGLAYVAGSNVNGGGMVIYDVATTPGTPIFQAFAPNVYAHDVFVVNDVMYASEIYAGEMTLYDVSDLTNITERGSVVTPFAFTHNIWTTADGQTAFTTDERSNASTAAYDVSDPLDMKLLDEFRPRRSLSTNTVPHNVHVLNDYLVISHYTDGVEIVDATDPCNLVEVGYFDSWTGNDGGGNGSWGAYPYLPSGLVLLSDISQGLYVFDVNYVRAARLVGTITDRDTGLPLNGVTISFAASDGVTTTTDALGGFKTGLATAATYTVTLSKPDYEDLVLPISMVNGVELTLDTFLVQTALPVRWHSFTAKADTKGVALSWETSAETNSDRFVVERSADGRVFTTIGEVMAAGMSSQLLTYEFLDNVPGAGRNYYRLRQLDRDGSVQLSEVRTVFYAGEKLSLYPNPATDRLYLTGDVSGVVDVYRADGSLAVSQFTSGRFLDISALEKGTYFLRAGSQVLPFVRR